MNFYDRNEKRIISSDVCEFLLFSVRVIYNCEKRRSFSMKIYIAAPLFCEGERDFKRVAKGKNLRQQIFSGHELYD